MNGSEFFGTHLRLNVAEATKRLIHTQMPQLESRLLAVTSAGQMAGSTAAPGIVYEEQGGSEMNTDMGTGATIDQMDPRNTTIFIGALAETVTETDLLKEFVQYGDIANYKRPNGKNYAFIQFMTRADAVRAMEEGNGKLLGLFLF